MSKSKLLYSVLLVSVCDFNTSFQTFYNADRGYKYQRVLFCLAFTTIVFYLNFKY